MKTIVVSGALKPGIAIATTRLLLDLGYAVIGTQEPEAETADIAVKNTNLKMFTVSHSKSESIDQFCKQIEGLPIAGFVNAQMYFNLESQDAFDHDAWDERLFVNLSMPNRIFRRLGASFTEDASIVVVSSTEAFMGSFGASAYAATKAGIHNLVKTWANVSGQKKIRANAIAAGWIGGVMDTDDVFNLSREITPLARLGSAEEVANVVEFLLSEKSSFINGSVITVDGGYSGVDRISKFEFESMGKS
jgi:NAD(P)-dependent dehydrogenase (short-subunit alcohol dehydrogenase family)